MKEIMEIIEKHRKYHKKYLMIAQLTGDEEDKIMHTSALATLKMLEMEIKGEKIW